jgi:hypothetical protein
MGFRCRQGHESRSDDYCDVCGAKNPNVAQVFMADSRAVGPPVQACPICSTQREGSDRYCGSCGYDFITGEPLEPVPAAGVPPAVVADERPAEAEPATTDAAPPAAAPTPPAARSAGTDTPSSPRLAVVLSIDTRRVGQPGIPAPPEDQSEHVFMLDQPSIVIGRADDPALQIPIPGDACVSRRHAEIIELDEAWGIRDLGSTNGTRLNGVELVGAEVKRIRPGDVIELGYFSRLTVQPSAEAVSA